jgi:hypothetical protein
MGVQAFAPVVTRALVVCGFTGILSQGCLSAAQFTMTCASSATTCTTGDNLKITLKLDTPAAAEAYWADGNTSVSITERDDPAKTLPADLVRLQETGTLGDRQLNLHAVLEPANRRDGSYLSILYRKSAPAVPLSLLIKRPNQADTSLPFSLDLTSAYKDGTLGLILSSSEGPKCVTRADAPSDCGMGSILVLPFENLAQWQSATGHAASALTLYLNDVPMTGVTPLPGQVGDLSKTPYSLRFALNRDLATANSAAAWRALLSTADGSPITTTVSVGVDSIRWVYPQGQTINISIPRYSYLPWGIGALVVVMLWLMARFTPTLRAYPAVPLSHRAFTASSQQPALARISNIPVSEATFTPPYSLSMLFMALWIFVVSLSFFSLWGLTHSDMINTTALALLGIGATSMVFSRAIDIPTDDDKTADRDLATAITAYAPDNPALENAVTDAVKSVIRARLATTGHWMSDLFSEKGSPRLDLHRLQLAAFTAFYFVVFLWSLNTLLTLPDFSPNTLALLGISNAGYLGFKLAAQ